MKVGPGARRLAAATCLAIAGVLATSPAGAVEPPSGSRNFTAPGYVPNYFSNESGPFHSGANARVAQPGVPPGFAAPAPRPGIAVAAHRHDRNHSGHAGAARGHYRLARRRPVAHGHGAQAHAARHGGAPVRRIAHADHGSGRGKAIVATAHHHPAPPGKPRHAAHVRG